MEWRINELQSEVRRLRTAVEALKTTLESQECRRLEVSRNRAYLAGYLVTTAVLLAGLWHGFGWI
jgi:hypothetical protein